MRKIRFTIKGEPIPKARARTKPRRNRDGTPKIINNWLAEHPGNSVNFVHNGERVGMLANNLAGFRRAADGDIGIELNGDDWLPDPGVLTFLNKVYDDNDVWMTYNTLRQTDGTILFQSSGYDETEFAVSRTSLRPA